MGPYKDLENIFVLKIKSFLEKMTISFVKKVT